MRPADERVEKQREDGEFEHYFQRARESPLISQQSLAKAGALERLAHSPKGAAVIDLEHQEIVGALGPDLHGDVLLAAHRIQRHDAALPVQGLQQLRDRDDLIRLAVDRALAQRQSLFAGPGAGSDRLGRQVWPSCVAERVLAAVTRNDYGVLDNLVRAICPALGETGVAHLKARLTAAQAKRPTTDRFDGRSYALRAVLQDIADAE